MTIKVTRRHWFQRPTVGPKLYLAIGASGWVETFDRQRTDAELKAYVNCSIDTMVDNFLAEMSGEERTVACWKDVIEYIGRIVKVKAEAIPMGVAIAFWGQVVIAENAKGVN